MQQVVKTGSDPSEGTREFWLQEEWGVPHAVWDLLLGIGGALYLLPFMIRGFSLGYVAGLPFANVLGLILVAIGACILLADLGRPRQFVRALVNYRTSWISIGGICDFIFIIFGILVIAPYLELSGARPFGMLPWMSGTVLGGFFQAIVGVAAFMVMIYAGLAMAYSRSIPFWHNLLLPIQFLVSSLTGGLAVSFIMLPFIGGVNLGTEDAVYVATLLLLANIIFTSAHLLTAAYSSGATSAAKGSVRLLTSGRYSTHFLGGVIVAGLLVPMMALGITYVTQGSLETALLVIAGVCIITGSFLIRLTFLKAGVYGDITGSRTLTSFPG